LHVLVAEPLRLINIKRFIMKYIYAFLVLFYSFSVHSFEQNEIIFYAPEKKGKDIKFLFYGMEIKKPVSFVKANKEPIDENIKEFLGFFRVMYEANLKGGKDDILVLWDASDRKDIMAIMDDESLSANKARFSAIEDMKLKMIVEYGERYICFVSVFYEGDRKFEMNFPVVKRGEKMYLSNSLKDDYFYNNVIPHLAVVR
jgi:hypothetical protein